MIKRALPPGGAFSIYSEGETDCQPKMTKNFRDSLILYILFHQNYN